MIWCAPAMVSDSGTATGVLRLTQFEKIHAIAFLSDDPWDLVLRWVDSGVAVASKASGYQFSAIPVANEASVAEWSDIYTEPMEAIHMMGEAANLFYAVTAVGTPTTAWNLSVHGTRGIGR